MNSRILTLLLAMFVLTASCNKSNTTPNNSNGGSTGGGSTGGGNTGGGNTGGGNNSGTPTQKLEFKLDGKQYTGTIIHVGKQQVATDTRVLINCHFTRNTTKYYMSISMNKYKGIGQHTSSSSIHFAKQQPDSMWGGFSPVTIDITKDSSTYLSGTFSSDMEVYMAGDPQRTPLDTVYLTDGKLIAHW